MGGMGMGVNGGLLDVFDDAEFDDADFEEVEDSEGAKEDESVLRLKR
jgi:hypothetical protein